MTKRKQPGVLLTVAGTWRCLNCDHTAATTLICEGAHPDGSPRCSKAVCEHCGARCLRCNAPLCQECATRSKEGALCVQCPLPEGGRDAYNFRRQTQASAANTWKVEADSTARASAEAQQSVDEAMRRADEIERQINEMKERMRRSGTP